MRDEQRYGIRPLDCSGDIDFRGLALLHDGAWRADNSHRTRYVYDEKFFRWALAGDDWIGVAALDADGTPVGSVFSFLRSLRCGRERFAAGYSTALAVAPSHRGAGLGRALYDAMRIRLFEERRRTIGVAVFQSGHGGLPTVASGLRRAANMDTVLFHQGKIWSKRLRQSPAGTNAEPLPRPTRVDAGTDVSGCDERGHTLCAVQTLECLTHSNASIRFDMTDSFARMYLTPSTGRAGMLAYGVGTADECALTFSLMRTAIDATPVGTIAQLQTLHAGRCTRAALEAALTEFCASVERQGCIAVTIVDQGQVPTDSLRTLGFAPSADELVFSVRGAPADLALFKDLQPPYLLDFI